MGDFVTKKATSYASFADLIRSYKAAGGRNDDISPDFNKFDNPAHFYFRLFFDFGYGLLDASGDLGAGNIIDENKTTGYTTSKSISRDFGIHNSALNYLVINNEWERADMLRQFITLLSNISMRSPWYFQEISGIGEAIGRTEFTGDAFAIQDTKTVTIKCLPDAYDNRIGTLLDLYRSICYSYHLHKEIVPGNLRRFNMYLYIFNTNIRGIHSKTAISQNAGKDEYLSYTSDAVYDQDGIQRSNTTGELSANISDYITSSKLIEFHNCEFDMNSNATGYESVNNADGFESIYTIGIKYAYATEQRYNEFLLRSIGDFVLADMDLPGSGSSTEETPDAPIVVWDKDRAAFLNTIKPKDDGDRIHNFDASQHPDNGTLDDTINAAIQSLDDDDSIKTVGQKKIFRNIYEQSTMDPWSRLIADKASSISNQFQRVIQAGSSAIDSWTNLGTLNENLVDSLKVLSYGNLFRINENNISTGAINAINQANSSNVMGAAGASLSGWVHRNL